MDKFENRRIKWPYATHLIDPKKVTGLLPALDETNPGALLLARVVTLGRHRDLEGHSGRRVALFPGDVFAAVLGNRYATDQFEAVARCAGTHGHIAGIGGVCGEVVSMNSRMTEPTVIEWLGRLAGDDGGALHLSAFRIPAARIPRAGFAPTVLSLGASMNAGKTTTAAQVIHSLVAAGHRVAAAKITGTACVKDPNLLRDAGAVAVLDFTHAGLPSTAGCSLEELLAAATRVRAALEAHDPEFVVIEIADGVVQRETAMLLADPSFRASIDAVTFAGPDALSCDAGVRRLRELGYHVLATAGIVANGRLGISEVESACGVRCLNGESLLAGELVPALRALRGHRVSSRRHVGGGSTDRPTTRTALGSSAGPNGGALRTGASQAAGSAWR